jgi:hypothetical protein
MTKYRIFNRRSGADLGVYEAPTPAEALQAMYADAGYADAQDADSVTEGGSRDLVAVPDEPLEAAER